MVLRTEILSEDQLLPQNNENADYLRAQELGQEFPNFKDEPKYIRRLLGLSREYVRKIRYMETSPRARVDTDTMVSYDEARQKDHDALCVMLYGERRANLPPHEVRDVEQFAYNVLGEERPEPTIN